MSEVALGNIRYENFDLIILPAGFANPTTALRPPAIAVVFGYMISIASLRAEDYIRRYVSVNFTG
jgi:hypothetical protein